MKSVQVKLLADFLDGVPIFEMVLAELIGPDRFRIIASPGLAPGTAGGDEIELLPGEEGRFRVTKRSGNVCVQLFLATGQQSDQINIARMFDAIGGWLDGGARETGDPRGSLLIFTIPITIGFNAIEAVIGQISASYDVSEWMYGNVYDTADGVTPLNWWLENG